MNHHKLMYTLPALAAIGLAAGCSTTVHTSPPPSHSQTTTPPAPPPSPTPTLNSTYTGTGNQNTPSFQAPATGDYTVTWQYSNNNDPTFGGPTNFAISATDSNADSLGLPNDIQSSGSGSTEITSASGTESFNVQAVGNWTITVRAAP